MIYGVCTHCSHTQSFLLDPLPEEWKLRQQCYTCGCNRWFRVVRQIEQPDGSVIEVTA